MSVAAFFACAAWLCDDAWLAWATRCAVACDAVVGLASPVRWERAHHALMLALVVVTRHHVASQALWQRTAWCEWSTAALRWHPQRRQPATRIMHVLTWLYFRVVNFALLAPDVWADGPSVAAKMLWGLLCVVTAAWTAEGLLTTAS